MTRMLLWMIAIFGLMGGGSGVAWADEADEEYAKWLGRYDLETEPEKHEVLAKWCERNYPERQAFHRDAYHRYLFAEEEARLSDDPRPSRLKLMHERAVELELPDRALEYLGRWGEGQFAEHSARVKPGDVKMQKQLLAWCEREGVGFIESCRKLAHQIIEAEPDFEDARILLGHVRWDGRWLPLEEAIAAIDLADIEQRRDLHRAAAATRAKRPQPDYPEDPLAGRPVGDRGAKYFFPSKHPEARMYLSAKGYSPSEPTPLIVSLHGGGEGGFERANSYAQTAATDFDECEGRFVVLAPVATQHVTNSWGTPSNVEEVFDAMEEVCQLFNIDRTRIYITGVSMGGGGTTIWLSCFPELAAAYAGCAGFFWTYQKHEDLLGKPIILFQGEKDEQFRIDSRHKVIGMLEERNAKVEVVLYPERGHNMPDEVSPKRIEFFSKYRNDIEPDFAIMKAAIGRWLP